MEGQKRTNWKTTDNRFVAFIDILGFKDMIMRNSHEEIYEQLSYISSLSDFIEDHQPLGDISPTGVHIINFSDSIAVFSKSDTVDDFFYFTFCLLTIVKSIVNKGIMIKAGVAHGKTSVNKMNRIFFGQPIIDAYSMEEDVNYMGITCHSSIDKYFEANKKNFTKSGFLLKYFKLIKTPLKCGKIHHYNIMWFTQFQNDQLSYNDWIKHIQSLYSNVSGSPRRYLDNTIEVIEAMIAKEKNSD